MGCHDGRESCHHLWFSFFGVGLSDPHIMYPSFGFNGYDRTSLFIFRGKAGASNPTLVALLEYAFDCVMT